MWSPTHARVVRVGSGAVRGASGGRASRIVGVSAFWRRSVRLGLGVLALAGAPSPASAYDVTDELDVFAVVQTWLTVWQQAEQSAGLVQYPNGDQAADTTTGFSIQRARVGAEGSFVDDLFGLRVQLKLERNVELLDGYARVSPGKWLEIRVGQFKTPTTYENLSDDATLDFVTRTRISNAISDYSLSRTHYTAAQLAGNRSNQRDLGLGLGGQLELGPVPLRYRFMLGNGLGANLWIGPSTSQPFALTNPGQFYYGGRLELEPVPGIVALGGHASYNQHDDMALGGAQLVVDLKRTSWSADVRLDVPAAGLRATGLYGGGAILEDYYADGKDDLWYHGWEGKVVWRVSQPLRVWTGADWLAEHAFELGFRYDGMTTEVDESGSPAWQRDYAFGLAYLWRDFVKVQIDYVLRRTEDRAAPDLDDDGLTMCLQGAL
jgi:hypothetical protein